MLAQSFDNITLTRISSFTFLARRLNSPDGQLRFRVWDKIANGNTDNASYLYDAYIMDNSEVDASDTVYTFALPSIYLIDDTSIMVGLYSTSTVNTGIDYLLISLKGTNVYAAADIIHWDSTYGGGAAAWEHETWGDLYFIVDDSTGAPSTLMVSTGVEFASGDGTYEEIYGDINSLDVSGNTTSHVWQIGTSPGSYNTENITSSYGGGAGHYGASAIGANYTAGVTYYWRFGALGTTDGWKYGIEKSFVFPYGSLSVVNVSAVKSGTDYILTGNITNVLSTNATSWGFEIRNEALVNTENITFTGSQGLGTFNGTAANMTPGTRWYWRSVAFTADAGPFWSSDDTIFESITVPHTLPTVSMIAVASSPVGGGNLASFTAEVTSLGTAANVSSQGFYVGTANGTWDKSGDVAGWTLSLGGTQVSGNGTGIYSIAGLDLTENVTYFYQAFVYGLDVDNVTGLWGYSSIGSFVYHAGVYNYGIIRTAVARPSGTVSGTTGLFVYDSTQALNFGVVLLTAPVSIVEYGTTYWYGTTNKTVKRIGNWSVYTFDDIGGMNSDPIVAGTVVSYQAYMVDQNGHVSQGITRAVTMGSLQQMLLVTTGGAQVSGTTAYLSGTSVNAGFYTIDAIGFTWGTSTNGEGAGAWQTIPDLNNTAGVWHYTAGNLTLGTHYYTKAFVVVAQEPVWGQVTDFVTPAIGSNLTAGAPTIRTDPATGITVNGFVAHGTVVDIGGDNVSGAFFDFSTTSQYWQQRFFVPGTTNITGSFSMVISGLTAGSNAFFRAGATNRFDTGLGDGLPVRLATSTVPGQNLPPGTMGVSVDGFVNLMAGIMGGLGMDTPMGHWGFMFLLIIIVAVLGVVFIVTQEDRLVKKIFAIITGALIAIILAAFIFSGLLGLITIIVVILLAIAAITLFVINKTRGTN